MVGFGVDSLTGVDSLVCCGVDSLSGSGAVSLIISEAVSVVSTLISVFDIDSILDSVRIEGIQGSEGSSRTFMR